MAASSHKIFPSKFVVVKIDESYTWQIEKFSGEKFTYVESRNGYDCYALDSSSFELSMVKNGQMKKLNLRLSLTRWRRG